MRERPDPPLEAWTFLKQEVKLRGSTTGAALRTLPDGRRVVVKRGGAAGGNRAAHIRNEFDMNRYLNELGLTVPNARMTTEDGRPTMITQFEEGARAIDESDYGQLRRDIVPHALISNWDVVGMDYDNVLRRPDGKLTYVDVGGAGPYRAQGAPKGAAFGPIVNEFQSFEDHMPEIYYNMSDEEIGQSYDQYGGVDAMTNAASVIQNPQVADMMRLRAQDIARRVA
jgi:hypothetical protein